MENPRPEKVAVVDEVRAHFDAADAALLTEYRGLDVAAMATLRRALADAGGRYKIYKNTLVRFAARDLGLEIDPLLTGPTAIAFVDGDPVNVAKALRDFARANPALVVKGGVLGERVLDAAGARALADVEPREVLLARLAGAMAAPMQQLAGLLSALPRNLAYGIKALIDQQGGVPEAAPPAVDDADPADDVAPADDSGDDSAPAADDAAPADDVAPADDAAPTDGPPPADDVPADDAAPPVEADTPTEIPTDPPADDSAAPTQES